MRKSWDAANDQWYVFVDDPQDPALREFAFPDASYEWLRSPSTGLLELAAVEEISPSFLDRLRNFIERGQVHVACFAEGDWESGDAKVLRPGNDHVALLGPADDNDAGIDGAQAVSIPLVRAPGPKQSWDAFPRISPEFRAACEQLAGVFLGGLYGQQWPIIEPCKEWHRWWTFFGSGSENRPKQLREQQGQLWALQHNYYGVVTLLQEPGVLVRADSRLGYRVMEEISPRDWLAGELEGGTRKQPAHA